MPRAGSIIPQSRTSGSTAPTPSRSGSIVAPSRVGSTVPPPPRADSIGASSPSLAGSVATHASPGSQLPLRSSQVTQRTRVPVSRTYYRDHGPDSSRLDNSRPPSYRSRNDDTDTSSLEDEDLSQNSHWNFDRTTLPGDMAIDEMSPDEDEREAEAALRGELKYFIMCSLPILAPSQHQT